MLVRRIVELLEFLEALGETGPQGWSVVVLDGRVVEVEIVLFVVGEAGNLLS